MASLAAESSGGAAESRIQELETRIAELEQRALTHSQLFNASPQPMWVVDRETLAFLAVNEAAVLTYGYTREEFAALRLTDLRPASEIPKVLEDIQQPFAGPGPWIHQRKDGSTFEVAVTACNIDFEGRTARLTIITDLTERRRIEAELRETQEHLHSFIEQATDSIFVADVTGTYIFVNESACKLLGYSREELVGKSIIDLIRPSEVRRLARVRDSILSGGSDIGEWELKRKDGTWVPVETSTKMLPGGRWQAFVRDISERKRSEQILRESEERMRIAVETAHLGTWELDLRTAAMSCSPRCKANFGRPADAEFGYDDLVSAIHLEDRAAMQGAIFTAIEQRVDYHAEYRAVWPDESIHWIVASGRALYAGDGQPQRMVGVTLDVTDRKQVEEALARQAAALARSNADLQQFAYVTSHDLQEPLRMMASYAQILTRRYAGKLDTDADEYLNFIISGAGRLKDLIDALLKYSHVVNVDAQTFAPVSMDKALEWAESNLQILIEESGAVITHDELPTIQADLVRIVQLLQNLVGNAIKYRNVETPRVHVGAKRSESQWIFSVQDNGIGIAAHQQERIFGVFKRLHGPDVPGTGIGLAICKRIVEKHGGRIWVESEEGRGSTFYFSIPDVTPTPQPTE